MNENQPATITHHAMLVALGQFGQSISLILAIEAVLLSQRKSNIALKPKFWSFFSPSCPD